jgi:hypothetical protein
MGVGEQIKASSEMHGACKSMFERGNLEAFGKERELFKFRQRDLE